MIRRHLRYVPSPSYLSYCDELCLPPLPPLPLYAGVRVVVQSTPDVSVFRAAQNIQLHCYVITPSDYNFTWVGYCSPAGEEEEVVFISSVHTNSSAVLVIRSTPDTCLDRVVCRAEDGAGSMAEDDFWNTNVTG